MIVRRLTSRVVDGRRRQAAPIAGGKPTGASVGRMMTGRRRHSEPSTPSKAAKAEAKAGKREAFVVNLVQRSLRLAKVNGHRVGGGRCDRTGSRLFPPRGSRPPCVRPRFQASRSRAQVRGQSGEARSYGIYGVDDEVPLVAIDWRIPGWSSGRGEYRVSDSEGAEIATLSSALTIMVGAERIGNLKPAGWKPGRVEDNWGREVACIQRSPAATWRRLSHG